MCGGGAGPRTLVVRLPGGLCALWPGLCAVAWAQLAAAGLVSEPLARRPWGWGRGFCAFSASVPSPLACGRAALSVAVEHNAAGQLRRRGLHFRIIRRQLREWCPRLPAVLPRTLTPCVRMPAWTGGSGGRAGPCPGRAGHVPCKGCSPPLPRGGRARKPGSLDPISVRGALGGQHPLDSS